MFAIFISNSYSQSVTVTVFWTTGWCNICGPQTGNYSCNPPWSGSGQWNNGIRTFADPVPAGNVITDVSIIVNKVNCGYTNLCVNLNGTLIQCLPPAGGNCGCGTCWPQTYVNTFACPNGIPNWNYGGINQVQLVNTGTICVNNAVITLTYEPCCQPPVMTSTDVLCFGDCNGTATATVTGGNPPFVYLWNDPGAQTTQTATGLCAGTYTVTLTDVTNCTVIDSVTVTEPTLLLITNVTITNSNCGAPDGTISVTAGGGTPGYTYQWNTNATTSTVTGLLPGNYCVTISDLNGCTADTCVDVLINAGAVTMNLTFTAVLCNGDCSGDATATPTSGSAPYLWQWDNNALFQTTQTATGLCANTYWVTVTDNAGCTGVGQVTVTEPPPITISTSVTSNYNGSDITCFGACDGTAQVIGTGGTGGFLYQWSNAQITQNATGLCAGVYGITITDLNGCSKDTIITLTAPAPVTIVMSSDTTICEGTTANVSVSTSGGTPFYFESWNQGLPGNGPHIVSPTTNTCYSVSVTDANGCTAAPDSVCVTVLPPIVVTVNTSRDSVCDGEDVILTVSASGGNGGPYTYTWSNNLGTTQQVNAIPTTYPNCQTYTVTVSDACSPDIAGSIVVCFYATPTVSFSVDEFFGCEPLTVEFYNTSLVDTPATYEWNLGDGTIISGDTISHTYEFAGQFDITLTVTSIHGCSSTLTYPTYIIVNPNPVADFAATPQPTTVMNTMIDFLDRSEGGVNQWIWTFTDPLGTELGSSEEQNPTFVFPGDTGMFPVNLLVTTTDGCIDDTTKYIEINGFYNVYVPNAFTPNGDGLNDEFFPTGVGVHPDNFVFTIYDRWGEIIFRTTSLEDKWDGTAQEKGGTEIVENGVYVWRIEAKESTRISEQQHQYVGHVTLIK